MDAVRFSIIENELNWNEFINDDMQDYDDLDRRSISNESSGGGVPMPSTCDYQFSGHVDLPENIWERQEIDATFKELANADKILDMIKKNEIISLDNEQDINTALLLSVWHGNYLTVSQLFSMCKTNANAIDSKGRTALHFSCFNGDYQTTKILLYHKAEVNCWDIEFKATPLHCASSCGSSECVQLLLRHEAKVNAGIEHRSSLHYAVQQNAIKCVQLLLQNGAIPNTPQVYTETPLHVAAALGNIECMRLLLQHGADARSQFGPRKITALHLCAADDYAECAKLLLDNGASIDAKNADNQTPLHVACLDQSIETTELLIARGANVNAAYRDGRTALHAAIVKESRFWDCARLLLDAKADVNKADHFGYSPLHIAALNEFSSCVLLLIDYGADITARTNGGVSALSFIVRRTPEVIPKYLGKFDSSIKVNNEHEIGDVDCEIKLDFRVLVPNADRGETELLLAFIDVGQKRVLKHPLCETFLFLKWRRIRKFFLFSLFYHALFVLLFTFYVLGVFCPKNHDSLYLMETGYLVLFLNFVLLTKELFQIAHGFYNYITYWENWLQWLIIIGVFLCSNFGGEINRFTIIPEWQYHVAGIVIFLVWLELMMLVGRFPIFGLYVQMFTTVAVNFGKFLLAYCCLIVAFGLSFRVLFSNHVPFYNVQSVLMKTIVMMAGELDFEDTFYKNESTVEYSETDNEIIRYPVTSHIMFIAFVLLVTIILTNLLVGLAVSDIQGLQASAGLDRLLRQAELVSRLEGLMFSRLLSKAPKHILSVFRKVALLKTSRCHLQLHIKPNDPREHRIPRDLITSIYKLVAERRDRNQSIRRRHFHRNLFNFKESVNERPPSVQIRSRGSFLRNLRNNIQSEHPNDSYKLPKSKPSSPLSQKIFIKNENTRQKESLNESKELSDILAKLELFQTQVVKQLTDINEELKILKSK